MLKPTTHFCITNQELIPDNPEFYSHYLLLNTKSYKPYTKNIGINVLQLNYIDMATEEDIRAVCYSRPFFSHYFIITILIRKLICTIKK